LSSHKGRHFLLGTHFYIWWGEVLPLAPLNNVKICCLFQKHGKRTTMHTLIHTFKTPTPLAYPQKGKKKKKKQKKAGSIGCMLQFPIGSSRIFIPNCVQWRRLMAKVWIVGTECTRGPHPSSKQHMDFDFFF